MFGTVWLFALALSVAPAWALRRSYKPNITCEDFVKGVQFNPYSVMGEWTTVYGFAAYPRKATETITIRELNSDEVETHDEVLKNYPADALKLSLEVHITDPILFDVEVVLVPEDDQGNLNAWAFRINNDGEEVNLPKPYSPLEMKWKIVDGFLLLMMCKEQVVFVESKAETAKKSKLQRLLCKLRKQGLAGGGIIH